MLLSLQSFGLSRRIKIKFSQCEVCPTSSGYLKLVDEVVAQLRPCPLFFTHRFLAQPVTSRTSSARAKEVVIPLPPLARTIRVFAAGSSSTSVSSGWTG
mgnify:CR=1 FL=1